MRFPLFEKSWSKSKLKNICSINPKNNYLIPDNFLYIDLESVKSGVLVKEQIINKKSAPSRAQRCLEYDDILYSCVRPYQHNNFIYRKREHAVSSTGFAILRNQTSSDFLYCLVDSKLFESKVLNCCTGTSYPAINTTDLGNIEIFYPEEKEQEKIGSFINLLNKRIETQNKIIEDLKLLIKRSIDSLLHTRFPSEMFELRKLLTERKEKNTNNFPVFSVAVEDGIVNQEEHLGRSFAAKDTSNYNVVRQGNIVYTKSPTGLFPYGIIKQSLNKECVAVSPLYGVYEPKSIIIGSYLHFYFMNPVNANNYLHALVNKGAKNTMNITNQRFLDGKILFPKEIFQNIVGFLESINKKLDLNVEILKKYQRQKEYFLNNLFI